MNITIITAQDPTGLIGIDNDLPWHLPEDLKFFKDKTFGKSVVMGRKTFESLGNKPLPRRQNIVFTRDKQFHHPADNVHVVHSLEELEKLGDRDLMIIGGRQIYEMFLPLADEMYITHVKKEYSTGKGLETYFPPRYPFFKKYGVVMANEDFEIVRYVRKQTGSFGPAWEKWNRGY